MRSPNGRRLTRLLLVDDHPLVREGLRAVLQNEPDIEIVAEASSGDEALEYVRTLDPHVILMDIQIPGTTGLEVMRQIHHTHPGVAIIMLTVHDSEMYCIDAIRSGARGYLLKDSSCHLLGPAIRAALEGGSLVESSLLQRVVLGLAGTPRRSTAPAARPSSTLPTDLTPRELDILRRLARGYHNKAISEELHLAPVTVKKYVQAVMSKLGATDRTQAALAGVRLGLAD